MEKIDLRTTPHAERQRWRSGDEWSDRATKIAVGRLADGRWYVRMYGGGIGERDERVGRAYAGPNAEHYARNTAARWMRTIGGTWVEA